MSLASEAAQIHAFVPESARYPGCKTAAVRRLVRAPRPSRRYEIARVVGGRTQAVDVANLGIFAEMTQRQKTAEPVPVIRYGVICGTGIVADRIVHKENGGRRIVDALGVQMRQVAAQRWAATYDESLAHGSAIPHGGERRKQGAARSHGALPERDEATSANPMSKIRIPKGGPESKAFSGGEVGEFAARRPFFRTFENFLNLGTRGRPKMRENGGGGRDSKKGRGRGHWAVWIKRPPSRAPARV